MGFEKPKSVDVDPEMLRIAQNFLQLHFAQHGHPEDSDICTEIEDMGKDFRIWFDSPEGKTIMADYVKKHTPNEIGHFAGMEQLERLFIEYRDRILH